MTSLLRALSLRARVLSLNCSQFVALVLVRLTHLRRASRHEPRPARARYAHSGFRRFACLAMAVVMFLQVPASPHVSHTMIQTLSSKAVNSWESGRFWWHSSGWAARAERLRDEYLPNIGATDQQRG